MFSCRQCKLSDPTTDTVKISFTPEQRPAEEEEEARRRAEEEEEERLRQEAETERRRQEAADRAEAERLQQEECLRAQEAEAAEARRREREAEEAARQQRLREEAEAEEQRRQEEERQHRQAKVAAFLKAKGFKSVTAPKRSMMKTTYPIILAAEAGDTEMVELLIQEGADLAHKNSSGKTAQEAAMKKNKKSSHDGVLRALGGA